MIVFLLKYDKYLTFEEYKKRFQGTTKMIRGRKTKFNPQEQYQLFSIKTILLIYQFELVLYCF